MTVVTWLQLVDMARNWNFMSESFLLSNIAPQVGSGFNRHIWKSLELAVRGLVEQRGTHWSHFAVKENLITYKVIGDNHVAVPTNFYKIVVDANNRDKLEALAFILPNKDLSGHHYTEFLTTIDEIEVTTGLDFLSDLPAAIQHEVESQKATSIW